jgi:hypothetical protein
MRVVLSNFSLNQEYVKVKKQNCIFCGELVETNICRCCLFINNHPEVIRDDVWNSWDWVVLEAMEQAAERTLFAKTEQDLKKGIDRLNRKLKRRSR